MKIKYKKVLNNENVIEIDGKVVLSFDPRYKEYLKWRVENPVLEERLLGGLEKSKKNRQLYNNGAPHEENNVCRWYNDSGDLILEAQVKGKINNKHVLHGYYKSFSEDGKLLVKGFYNMDYKDKTWIWNWPSGEKMTEKVYEDKVLRKVSEWHEDGTPIAFRDFKVDLLDGESIIYDSAGNVASMKTYMNSKLHGKYIEYFTNTIKRVEGVMRYNMMQDKWTFWYYNGQKELECEFDFGEPVGTAKMWRDNGKLKGEVKL